MSFENKHNSVDIALDDVNELFFETARLSLKKKQVKKSTKRKNNKRWYDRSLQELRMSVALTSSKAISTELCLFSNDIFWK
jgi:hypothetical protein